MAKKVLFLTFTVIFNTFAWQSITLQNSPTWLPVEDQTNNEEFYSYTIQSNAQSSSIIITTRNSISPNTMTEHEFVIDGSKRVEYIMAALLYSNSYYSSNPNYSVKMQFYNSDGLKGIRFVKPYGGGCGNLKGFSILVDPDDNSKSLIGLSLNSNDPEVYFDISEGGAALDYLFGQIVQIPLRYTTDYSVTLALISVSGVSAPYKGISIRWTGWPPSR